MQYFLFELTVDERERGGAPGFSVEPGTVALGVGIAALPTRHIRCCFSGSLGFTVCVCVRVFANLS